MFWHERREESLTSKFEDCRGEQVASNALNCITIYNLNYLHVHTTVKHFPRGQVLNILYRTRRSLLRKASKCLNVFDMIYLSGIQNIANLSLIYYWYVRYWVWLQIYLRQTNSQLFRMSVMNSMWASWGEGGSSGGGVSHILRWHLSLLTIRQIITKQILHQIAPHYWKEFSLNSLKLLSLLTLGIDIIGKNILILS